MIAPNGTLTRTELRRLAVELAADPDEWRHLVHHDPTARTYEQLLRNEHVAVWYAEELRPLDLAPPGSRAPVAV